MSAILLALALAASPATKLGVYVVGAADPASSLLATCPVVVVFPLPSSGVSSAQTAQMRAFRSACPSSRVVAQVGDPQLQVVTNPASVDWLLWEPLLNTAGLANFDAVEGPSEPQGSAADVAAFWSAFAGLVQSLGKLPIVGSLDTGGTGSSNLCPTADAMVARGGSWAWSYHAFSTGLTQVVPTEASTTLGYRILRTGCPSLTGIPIYLTQAGRANGSWQTADMAWLAWLDARLAEDGEVVGAALFEAGGGTDRSLEPIASQLAAYLQNPSTPDGGTVDGGTDAGAGGIAGGGTFLPSGPPAKYPSGCASAGAGAGLALLALVTPLVLRRRKHDHSGKG